MLRLHRLSITPAVFEPIEFHSGVNLIVGEASDTEDTEDGKKVNGVGKSLFVEFLHFGLLRGYKETRVSKIPNDLLSSDSVVTLECTVGARRLRIERAISAPEHPKIFTEEGVTEFDKLETATNYLGELLNNDHPHRGQVSFRQVVSLLMRDEKSNFQNFLNPHEKTNRGVEYERHLYLMGIPVDNLKKIELLSKEITDTQKRISDYKRQLETDTSKKLNDIPLYLSEEAGKTKKIQEALLKLQTDPAFKNVEEELVSLESRLKPLRAERKSLSYQIDQIERIPLPEQIDTTDMHIIYDKVKSGLGELVCKSLNQAQEFKRKVEAFQSDLRNKELQRLRGDYKAIQDDIRALSQQHSSISKSLQNKELLSEIKIGVEAAMQKTQSFNRLEATYQMHQERTRYKEELKSQKDILTQELRHIVDEYTSTIKSLLDTLKAFHLQIQGSEGVSLKLSVNSAKKNPIEIDYRITDDGSSGVNRSKTFLYDFTLMLSPTTSGFHPGFLLHDNILEMDQEGMKNLLNFLHDQSEIHNFQYVLTLNRDKLEPLEKDNSVKLDITALRLRKLTKDNQFLGKRYAEE